MLNSDTMFMSFQSMMVHLDLKHFYISNMLSPYLMMVVDNAGLLWTGGGNDNIQYSPNNIE